VGQKVHPIGFRLGILTKWESNWYAEKEFSRLLHEDIKIRKYVKKKLYHAGISKIGIERTADKVRVNIHASRPGIIIGKRGTEVDVLRKDLAKITPKEVFINIKEVRKPEMDAQLVSESVALQLERRVTFRRAMKKAVSSAMKFGAKGIKITCAGRLGGAEIAPHRVVPRGAPRTPCGRHRLRTGRGPRSTADRSEVLDLPGEVLEREPWRPGRSDAMLAPKKVNTGRCSRTDEGRGDRGAFLNFGSSACRPPSADHRAPIEAARIAMTRHAKRNCKIWIRVFPDKPITKKPAETRMGKGKGNVEDWVAVIRPGRVLYEMEGVPETVARESLRLAGFKLPIRTRFVSREGML
jgi:small subunit ribosomal protein S3